MKRPLRCPFIIVALTLSVSSLSALQLGVVYSSTAAGGDLTAAGLFSELPMGGWGVSGSLSLGFSPYYGFDSYGDSSTLELGFYLEPTLSLSIDLLQSKTVGLCAFVLLGGEYALTDAGTIPRSCLRPAYADIGLGGSHKLGQNMSMGVQLSTTVVGYVIDGGFFGIWQRPYCRLALQLGFVL